METKRFQLSSISIALLVLLLCSIAYNIYQYNKQKGITENFEQVIQEENLTKESLEMELQTLSLEYDSLQMKLAFKDSLFSERDKTIASKSQEIKALLSKSSLSKNELQKAKILIASLRSDINNYQLQIEKLKIERDSVIYVKDSISSRLSNEEKKVKNVESSLSSVKSTLSTSNFSITSYKVKNSGKLVEKDKSSKVNRMEITFTIDPNPLAEKGEKIFYVAIYNPNNQLIILPEISGGEITLNSGESAAYSMPVSVEYDGTQKTVKFNWNKEEFEPGTYRMNVYQNGFKVGQQNISLR